MDSFAIWYAAKLHLALTRPSLDKLSPNVQQSKASARRSFIYQQHPPLPFHLCSSTCSSHRLEPILQHYQSEENSRSKYKYVFSKNRPARFPCGIPPHSYSYLRSRPRRHWPWLGKCCWELASKRETEWGQVHSASCSSNPYQRGEFRNMMLSRARLTRIEHGNENAWMVWYRKFSFLTLTENRSNTV